MANRPRSPRTGDTVEPVTPVQKAVDAAATGSGRSRNAVSHWTVMAPTVRPPAGRQTVADAATPTTPCTKASLPATGGLITNGYRSSRPMLRLTALSA